MTFGHLEEHLTVIEGLDQVRHGTLDRRSSRSSRRRRSTTLSRPNYWHRRLSPGPELHGRRKLHSDR